jgi:tRNA-dihydrouridine synthase
MFKRRAIYKIREKILIAPMIDVTDNYFRYFARFITKHSFLNTKMINEHVIINIYQSGN